MTIAADIIKFAFAVLLIYYIPGHIFLRRLRLGMLPYEAAVLSLSAGILVVPQIYYYLEGVRLHNVFLMLMILSSAAYSVRKVYRSILSGAWPGPVISVAREAVAPVAMALIVAVMAALAIGTSGLVYPDGMRFYQANGYDSVAQMAMVGELSKEPPHQFPFYSGLPLKGYYVGSFYWRALIERVTHINAVDLFFRYSPLLFFPLLVMAVFVSVKRLSGSAATGALGVFLLLLMSDLSWVFPLLDRLQFLRPVATAYFSGSLLNWSFFNPPMAHGTLIFFVGSCLLMQIEDIEGRSRNGPAILFAGFLFGSLFEYKAFIWAVLFPAIILTGVMEYITVRRFAFLRVGAVAAVFSAISILRISSGQATFSLFRPAIGYYPVAVLRDAGFCNTGWSGCPLVILGAFLFFLAGVLGIKLAGFYKVYTYAKRWRTAPPVMVFLLIAAALSFIFTHTLMLKSNYEQATYNFFAPFLMIMSVFAAEAIIDWTRRVRPVLRLSIFSAIFIIGMGSTVFSLLAYLPAYSKYKALPKEELAAMEHIRKRASPDAVILDHEPARPWMSQRDHKECAEDIEGRDSFISALTGRRAVMECWWHMSIGNYAPDLKSRKESVTSFFNAKNPKEALRVLKDYSVDYVWASADRAINFDPKGLLEEVYSNRSVKIYRVLQ